MKDEVGSVVPENKRFIPSVKWGQEYRHCNVLMRIESGLATFGYKQQDLNLFIELSLTLFALHCEVRFAKPLSQLLSGDLGQVYEG